MRGEVVDPTPQRVEVLGREVVERHPAVRFRRAHRGDEHAGARREPAEPAHDVAELLEAEVAREPGLGDHVVGELQRDPVLDDRVVGVGDVAERPGVQEHGLVLEGLHEVGLDRVAHDDGHRAGDPEIVGGHRASVAGRGHDDPAEPCAKVLEIARQGEDRHDLRRRGDHEALLPGDAVDLAAEPDHGVAELAVVDVEGARPGDRLGVDLERVAVVDRRVERGRQQVVRRGDRVEVAVQVEVDLFHRDDLGVAAAGAAALDPEDRPHRRFAQGEDHVLADRAEALGERDGGRGLALAGLRRRDRRRDHELAVRAVGEAVQDRQRHLGSRRAVRAELLGLDPGVGRDLRDRAQLRGLGDLESGQHVRTLLGDGGVTGH